MSEILRLRDEFNMKKKFAVVLLAAACMGLFAAQASAARQTNWQPKANEYWIRVNKGRMTLTLYKGTDTVVSYPIACGRGAGFKKTSRFDFITPTGTYKIWRVVQDASKILYDPKWFNEEGEPYPAYGAKLISFYNNWQIAIHGTGSPRSIGRRVTHGCVRLRNQDITALSKYVTPPMHLEIIDGVDDARAYNGSKVCEERFLYKETI